MSVVKSLFLFKVFLNPLFVFLVSLAKGFSILYFQKTTLSFIDFLKYFLPNLYFIYSILIFIISFLLITLGQVCSLYNFLKCKFRWFILNLSCGRLLLL